MRSALIQAMCYTTIDYAVVESRSRSSDVPILIINPIPKSRRINHRQADPHSVLLKLNIVALDLYRLLDARLFGMLPERAGVDG